ncbi:MAG: hypothetical protein PF961_13455 [Planctomycetota bacterium]|jgi:hypothetical protein|nr:hypothetical protein [Planctomycetota bacterium]
MSGVLAIPGNECYWALLTASDARLSERARRYRFEAVLPVPVDELQVAGAALADGRHLLVGVASTQLRSGLAQLDAPTSARPADLPAHLLEQGVDPEVVERLELLHGAFEPTQHRARRNGRCIVSVSALVLAAVLLVVGGLLRARDQHAVASHARTQAAALANEAVPQQVGAQRLPPALRLQQEVRRARQAAQTGGPEQDLLPVLETLFAAWPPSLRVQVDTIGLDPGHLVIRGRVPDPEAGQTLAAALAELNTPLGAWRARPLDLPRVADGAASFLLAFEPETQE